MSESSDLLAVRAALGLTQAELARWLGVSRERVAQAEIKQRALPFAAWPQLTALTVALAAPLAPPPPEPAPLLAPVRARLRECRYQAERLRLRLRELETAAEPMHRRLAALPAAWAAVPAGPAHEGRRRWLQRLLDEAADCLARDTGAAAQALLRARLAAYEHEAALLARFETEGNAAAQNAGPAG